jgi:hypothetical protein
VSSTASTEVIEVGDLTAEDGEASTSTAFSSRTSSSLSESLRMMILLSPGGPRTSRLRSPKSFLANSSSYETSVMRSPSLEDEKSPPLEPSRRIPLLSLVSGGSVRKPPTETSAAAVIQMMPVVESWHRMTMGSPLWRKSERAWCISCLPSIACGEQER